MTPEEVAREHLSRWGSRTNDGGIEMAAALIRDTIERCAKEVENLGGDNAQFHADGIRRRLTDDGQGTAE